MEISNSLRAQLRHARRVDSCDCHHRDPEKEADDYFGVSGLHVELRCPPKQKETATERQYACSHYMTQFQERSACSECIQERKPSSCLGEAEKDSREEEAAGSTKADTVAAGVSETKEGNVTSHTCHVACLGGGERYVSP
eukprot:GHVU01029673.1.p1 GENE.GHVU01029673.1~~GHVU01029673.1.p1  ORF type:complete len:140 (-),score=15.76 GHVU01029673.1:2242-2661(-)